jgi:hypothetical protein
MSSRKRPAPAAPPPRRAEPRVSLPPRPGAPRQTFGDQMAAKMAMQRQMPAQPTRGGTPITVKDAPGYRGAGTPPMSPPQISRRPMSPPQVSRPAPPAMVDAVRASNAGRPLPPAAPGLNMSGMGMKKGGSVGSASKRADGCAQRGKTKGRMV